MCCVDVMTGRFWEPTGLLAVRTRGARHQLTNPGAHSSLIDPKSYLDVVSHMSKVDLRAALIKYRVH